MKRLLFLLVGLLIISPLVIGFEFDNVKSYDSMNKEVTIKNCNLWVGVCLIEGDTIGKAKLNTPLNVNVARGYQKVAEFDIFDYQDYNNALKQFTFKDMNNGKIKVDRNYDLKYLTYEDVNVNDYELKCSDVWNSSNNSYSEVCNSIVSGSHTEQKEIWTKITPLDLKNNDKLTVGVFTEVKKGDYVDWIPTIYGVEVKEWATWTEDLNTDLVGYWTLDETNGDAIDIANSNDGTVVGATYSASGKINTAYSFDGINDQITMGTLGTFGTNMGNGVSVGFWIKTTETGKNTVMGASSTTGNQFIKVVFNWGSGTSEDAGKLRFDIRDESGTYSFGYTTSDVVFNDGNWHYIVMTYDTSEEIKIYLNGSSQSLTTTYSGASDWSENFANSWIGSDLVSYWTSGIFDEIGFWNRVLSQSEVTQLYNDGTGISYDATIDLEPVITLNTPSSTNYTTSPQNLDINITASDDINLTDVKLYVNGILNQTNSSGINNSDYIFPLNLIDGNYIINGIAIDNESKETNSSSIRIIIDSINPTIDIITPNGTTSYNYLGNNETLNVTFTDTNLDTCWYNYNGTNITIDGCLSGISNSTNFTLESDNTNMTVYVNDSIGNENSTFIDFAYTYLENNRTYNTTSYETATETFSTNIEGVSSVALIYNGTSYTMTKSGNDYTRTLQMPVGKLGNHSIIFRYDDTQSSYTSYQNVLETVFTLCNSTYNTTFLNISFKDETNSSALTAAIPTSTFTYWLGDGTVYKTYTYINNTENTNYEFCASPNRTLYVDELIQYKKSGYPQRIYDQSDISLSNTTTNTILYLLSNIDGIYVTFQVYSGQSAALEGVEVTSTRTIAGSTSTVAQGTTDAAGSVTFWLNPDFSHINTFVLTGYETTILSIFPTQPLYTVTMGGETASNIIDNAEDITITTSPSTTFLDANTFYTFNYTISSPTLTLSEYGMNLTYDNGTVISLQTGSTSTGGTLDFSFNTTNNTKLKMSYYYITNSTKINGSTYWLVIKTNDYSIYHFFTRISTFISADIFGILGDDDGYFAKAMISILIIIMLSSTISYRYGLASEASVTGIMFGVVFMLNLFDIIPNPDFLTLISLGDFLVVFIALLAIGLIIKEETR